MAMFAIFGQAAAKLQNPPTPLKYLSGQSASAYSPLNASDTSPEVILYDDAGQVTPEGARLATDGRLLSVDSSVWEVQDPQGDPVSIPPDAFDSISQTPTPTPTPTPSPKPTPTPPKPTPTPSPVTPLPPPPADLNAQKPPQLAQPPPPPPPPPGPDCNCTTTSKAGFAYFDLYGTNPAFNLLQTDTGLGAQFKGNITSCSDNRLSDLQYNMLGPGNVDRWYVHGKVPVGKISCIYKALGAVNFNCQCPSNN